MGCGSEIGGSTLAEIMGIWLTLEIRALNDSKFISCMLLLTIGKRKLLPLNFNLFMERIQRGHGSRMLFPLGRRVCWPP
jgi:hypothetical protein